MHNLLLVENSTSEKLIKPSFSGHQTFPFRYTWLKKGADEVSDNPFVFSDEDAPVKLGVGKNMVQSIRHWCLTANIIEKNGKTSDDKSGFRLTEYSKRLFYDDRYDPYMENPSTLWWIHWNITTNIELATTWFWAFNIVNYPEFKRESLPAEIMNWLSRQGIIKKLPSENTLKKDIACFIRTYCLSRSSVSSILEDTFDCPLVELDLIREVPGENRYQFNFGAKPLLTESMILFAIADFWERWFPNRNTLSFSNIMYSTFSPGQVFKIDENSMAMCLEKIDIITNGGMTYDETAGLKQIYKNKNIELFEHFERVYEQKAF